MRQWLYTKILQTRKGQRRNKLFKEHVFGHGRWVIQRKLRKLSLGERCGSRERRLTPVILQTWEADNSGTLSLVTAIVWDRLPILNRIWFLYFFPLPTSFTRRKFQSNACWYRSKLTLKADWLTGFIQMRFLCSKQILRRKPCGSSFAYAFSGIKKFWKSLLKLFDIFQITENRMVH